MNMSAQRISDAIGNRSLLSFFYTGCRQIVEPHILGYDHAGDLTLYAWQVSGSNEQSWRSLHVDKMHGIALTGIQFSDVRPGFHAIKWSLTQIVCCVSQNETACCSTARVMSVERGVCPSCEHP
jgi:hypothetical protein